MSIKRATPEEKADGVRLFRDHRDEFPSEWAAMKSIAEKLGRTPETLRAWVRAAEVADGTASPELTAKASATEWERKAKAAEQEVKRLKRANEILKAASIFFATELDGPTKK
jgi:transposase